MRGLTNEEAEILRDELVREGDAVPITDAEVVIYDRLVARGLLKLEENAVWEVCEDDPMMEYPLDLWSTTDLGRRVLSWHEALRVGVAA